MALLPTLNVQIATETQFKNLEELDLSKARRLIKKRNEIGYLTRESLAECTSMDVVQVEQLENKGLFSFEQFVTRKDLIDEVKAQMDNYVTKVEFEGRMDILERKLDAVIQKLDIKSEPVIDQIQIKNAMQEEIMVDVHRLEDRVTRLEMSHDQFRQEVRSDISKLVETVETKLVINDMLMQDQRNSLQFYESNNKSMSEVNIYDTETKVDAIITESCIKPA